MEKSKQKELEILNSYYATGKNQILIVYGHLRTGSETVITTFSEDKQYKYYCACSASEPLQTYIWGSDLKEKGLEIKDKPNYKDIFESYEKVAITSGKPLVIFVENFEDIMKSSPDFLEEAGAVINKKGHPQMMLILMGSNAAWIENNMVEKLGNQASYISGFLKLKPYSFQEMRKRNMNMSSSDVISTYSIFGGNGKLWSYFDENKTFKQNVCEKFLDEKNSVLIRKTDYTLEENLRETAVYNTILYGLANGKNKLNDIHHATGFSRAKIMVYLKSLFELGMVEKVFSFSTTGHENVQKGVYRICDPLAAFYYRFLYQHRSQVIRMDSSEYFDKYIAKDFPEHANQGFRLVCREYLMKMSEYQRLPFVIDEEGEWVGKLGTIDIVAQSDTGDTLVAMTRWDKQLDLDSIDFLRNCSKRARLNPDYYYLFSGVGYDEKLVEVAKESPNIKLIGLDELLNG